MVGVISLSRAKFSAMAASGGDCRRDRNGLAVHSSKIRGRRLATGGGSLQKMKGKISSMWAGKIRRFLEAEGRPMRACEIVDGVLRLDGKRRLNEPWAAQSIGQLLWHALDERPAPWVRVARGIYAAAKKEGGAD